MAADFDIIEATVARAGLKEAVFGFGEVPWWDSEEYPAIVMDRAVTFEEVFSLAFPWEAIVEQLKYADGGLSEQYGIRRSDTLVELGVHSGNYGVVQPRDLFNFCAAFFTEGDVPISSAIAMRGGKVLNISARLNSIDVLNSGDIHQSYLCFVNSYDGSFKAQAYKSYIQPVCMNTTKAGLASADAKVGYRHTKNVRRRIEHDMSQAALLMGASLATDAKVKEIMETLAKRKVDKPTVESILNAMFGDSGGNKTENTKMKFLEVVNDGTNARAFPDFKGTAYGLYTAYTDYMDHESPIRMTDSRSQMSEAQVRAERALVGPVADQKEQMLTRILELTDGSTVEETFYSLPAHGQGKEENGSVVKLDAIIEATPY